MLIDYSSLMTVNQRDAPGPDKILRVLNYVVAQTKSSIVGKHWDPRFGNPLVAGSSPARRTFKGRSGVLQAGRTSQLPFSAHNSECASSRRLAG